ncbi:MULTISPECIES: hypothetical protein [Paraburkholderia]|nr:MULTISPECIES: hypothetical protein [Paraburkholderia]MPW23266.1 hypothetical protein [Paraburkholderia franconis]
MCGRPAVPCIPPVSQRDFDFLARMAEVESDLLTILADSEINRGQVAAAYQARFRDIGISTIPQFIHFLEGHVSRQTRELLNFPQTANSRLKGIISSAVPPSPSLTYNATLFALLFDRVQDAIDIGKLGTWTASQPTIQAYRSDFEKCVANNSTGDLDDLIDSASLQYEYLREFDSEWLENKIDGMSRERSIGEWRLHPSPRFDAKLAEYMEDRVRLLRDDSRRPRKITFSLMVSGFGGMYIPKKSLENMPMSRWVYEKFSEESLIFNVRLLRHIWHNQELYPRSSQEYRYLRRILSESGVESLDDLTRREVLSAVRWHLERAAQYRRLRKERSNGKRNR